MLKIGIVGAGATGTIFLYNFIQEFRKRNAGKIDFYIFEKRTVFGPGAPYQEDLFSVRLNQPINLMSIDANDSEHFRKWLLHHDTLSSFACEDYIPRTVYGKYLADCFNKLSHLNNSNIQVNIVNNEVLDIEKGDTYQLITKNEKYLFDYVILCTGHFKASGILELKNCENYIVDPYPLKETLSKVTKHDRIGILGSSLTAIDIAVSLNYLGHIGKIDMISRKGQLPHVSGESSSSTKYTPVFLTKENIGKIEHFKIEDIIDLLKKEFESWGLDWGILDSKEIDNYDRYSQKINFYNNDENKLYYSILDQFHEILNELWSCIDSVEKAEFKHLPLFIQRSVAAINARFIANMLNNNLSLKTQLFSLVAYENKPFILGEFSSGETVKYDWVFDATGLSTHINTQDSKLLNRFLEKGIAVRNTFGGIMVTPNQHSIIDISGKAQNQLRAIGHLTCGTHYFTNHIPYLVPMASCVAKDIIKEYYQKNL
ncbi:FAD/NAD(P)-binding protein [Bacillus thuringiensis]|uniref:FAD/NAD(P)-binding protein n=1 Tax=Bacillus thuringiensis TaxID=1428 RepID=UPI0025A5C3FC|nr:FAD/NAD(P)-binding protein [Bacillus thuringiensis]MDM8365620.1 FAD/NAD(P)-binding protein [Bacillus thuringiensis]